MVSKGKYGVRGGFRVIIYISRWQKLFLEYVPGALFWHLLMGRDFLNMTVALTFRKQWAIILRPVLRQGICLFVGTPSETKNYILLSTRGRRSCYSRPRVDDIVKDFWNPQCCFPIIKVLFGIKQYIYVGCSKSKKIKVCKEAPAPLKGRVIFFALSLVLQASWLHALNCT